ncbi:MAG TPA: RusA family crossover junction endodeoxyribonuclease [Nitrospirales bacterium]
MNNSSLVPQPQTHNPLPHRRGGQLGQAPLTGRNTPGTAQSKRPAPGEIPSDPFSLTLILPLPPSINHQYATVQGRRVLSSAGRRFKIHVGQELLCLLARCNSITSTMRVPDRSRLALDLRFYFVSALRRDIDSGLKITQDALCEALGINDNRIVEVSLRKEVDALAPRMELSLHVTD